MCSRHSTTGPSGIHPSSYKRVTTTPIVPRRIFYRNTPHSYADETSLPKPLCSAPRCCHFHMGLKASILVVAAGSSFQPNSNCITGVVHWPLYCAQHPATVARRCCMFLVQSAGKFGHNTHNRRNVGCENLAHTFALHPFAYSSTVFRSARSRYSCVLTSVVVDVPSLRDPSNNPANVVGCVERRVHNMSSGSVMVCWRQVIHMESQPRCGLFK